MKSRHEPAARTVPARLPADDRPVLSIIVDCEEGFDWRSPIRGTPYTLDAISGLARFAELSRRLGIAFGCVVAYPVLTDDDAWRQVAALAESGRAVLGAHLHAWVTPPFDEPPVIASSYQSSLPPSVEAAKVATIAETFRRRAGHPPVLFKAGRSGFGPATAGILAAEGFRVDVSYMPGFSYVRSGGPSFLHETPEPFFFHTPAGDLLELPDSGGFVGLARSMGPLLHPGTTSRAGLALHLPGLLSRLGLLERVALTPEGITQAEGRRLARQLHADGHRVFQLSFHSSSLVAGGTSYVPDEAAVEALLRWVEDFVTWFRQHLGGDVMTPDRILAKLEATVRARA